MTLAKGQGRQVTLCSEKYCFYHSTDAIAWNLTKVGVLIDIQVYCFLV